MSPSTSSTSPATSATFWTVPVEKLSRIRTSSPRRTSDSTRCEPMNPAPPVTNERTPPPTVPGGSRCRRLVRPAPRHHRRQRPQDQPHVRPQGPVGDVQVVELDHLLERDARAAQDLPQAGEARRQVDARAQPAVQLAMLGLDERARADEAHLALEDVPELRELVEARDPQQTPDARDPRVVIEQEPVRVAAQRGELLLALLRPDDHRAELDELEAASRAPHPRLPEQRR